MFTKAKYKQMLTKLALTNGQKKIILNALEDMMVNPSREANKPQDGNRESEYWQERMAGKAEGINATYHFFAGDLEGQDEWD